MMKRIVLLILTTLMLTSCNAKDTLNVSVSESSQQEISGEAPAASVSQVYEQEEQIEPEADLYESKANAPNMDERKSAPDEWLIDGAVYCEPGVDYQNGLRHPLIESTTSLHPVASEFIGIDGKAFAEKYKDINELYKQDIQYKLKGISLSYYDMLDTIRFGSNCKTDVINGLRVGDSTSKMYEMFGEPHFYNEELKLSGYRFLDFYLICVGENKITEISMTKYRRLPYEYQSLVSEYMSGKMPIQMGIPTEVAGLYSEYLYYYPGGFGQTLLYGNGVLFFSSDSGGCFLVWNNYEGEILTDTSNTLQFMNEDMYFYFMSSFYRREQTIFDRDGVYSPDGNIAAFSNNAGRPVEGDQIHIRWRDKSHCDMTFWTRHTQSDLIWLNNRYLLFNVYFGEPAYFDTLQNEVHSLREAAGISGGKEWSEVSYKKLDGNKLYLYNDPPYMIDYSFDKDGNILFQTELSTDQSAEN